MTTEQIATYRTALREARESFKKATKRLSEIMAESQQLGDEITKLRRTITALAAMCSESPLVDKLGITDACLEVMNEEICTVATNDVVKAVSKLGFDLESQKNASASVHAVLTRLARKGEITRLETEDGVVWRGRNYDEEFEKSLEMPF